MIRGEQYKLQCDIQDVAPVKSLRVKWFKGETLLNLTTFSDTTRSPVNESATLLITANKADDGVQYRCEAELELGPDGPQTPPTVTSKPLDITVHYKPKHSSSVEIISTNSNEVSLDCTVVANPAPTYTWHSKHLLEKKTSSVLPSSTLTPGNYTCTATNYLGKSSKVFIKSSDAHAECPVQFNPPRPVVKYNSPVSVNCSTTVPHDGMGWEKAEGEESIINDRLVTWNVQNLRQWEKDVFCYINYNESQCTLTLPITIYKTPDSVSISTVDHTGPMIRGEHYKLQCDIQDVAPVKSLRVKWFKGETQLNLTTFNDTTKTPVNESATLLITANKADDGVQYRCEAELELGPDGPQTPPTVTSKPLDITVHYKPKHSSSVEIISTNSNEVSLDCTVVANPAPTYTWHSKHLLEKKTSSVLPSSTLTPGNYTCTATNYLGKSSKVFIKSSEITFTVLVAKRDRDGIPFASVPGLKQISTIFNKMKSILLCFLGLFIIGIVLGDSCFLEISPSRVVVKFGDPVSVSCVASRPVRVLGWESIIGASHTQQDLSVQWQVDSLTDWIEEPICYGVFFTAPRQCEEKLNLVLYKQPDSVSIRLNHTSPVVEGRKYQLLCEVQNVAPVQYLVLRWYRGQNEVYNHSFSELSTAIPVQVSSTLLIVPNRADDGAHYRCEAALELGAEGPQPPPRVQSEELSIAVQYPPEFPSPKEEILEISEDGDMRLNCIAVGNPSPVYTWSSSNLQEMVDNQPVLKAASLGAGVYTCTASNILGKKSKQFVIKQKSKGV
ncbi:vascular cell adhesion protein 1 [Xyrauchen texanus]|uniref:vascular cell adhesion protein 1 n=1 Tax=Xyrauchen texanus TaxID=154827 RepID=UPI00224205F7|nr:vascular cell adhesion protein 1 [Xyrauchen texanus]